MSLVTHALILFACLLAGWALSAGVLRVVRRLPRWGDRRALHQLALFSPLLSLALAGGWSVQMALTGCLMFTTVDGAATLTLMAAVVAVLVVAAVRESRRIVGTRRDLAALAAGPAPEAFSARVAEIAERLGVCPPSIHVLAMDRPFACVAGVARPTLFVSRWMLEALTPDEADGLVAHELAHVRHADNLLAWLDVIVLRTFGFVPPMQVAWQESLAEREEAADARAAAVTGRPLDLASALLKVAEAGQPGPHLAGAAAFHGEAGLLERRIERLLTAGAEDSRPWGAPLLVAIAVAIAWPFITALALGAATACLTH